MSVDLELRTDHGRNCVLAKYADEKDVEDALAQCGIMFGLCFPNSDFALWHIPSAKDIVNEFGFICLEEVEPDRLPSYIRDSICKRKGNRGWIYAACGAYRRDWLMRFEFQERMSKAYSK